MYTESATRSYQFAALPRMMNGNANLIPIWSLGVNPEQTAPTTNGTQTHDNNEMPYLAGPKGRSISYEATTQLDLRSRKNAYRDGVSSPI